MWRVPVGVCLVGVALVGCGGGDPSRQASEPSPAMPADVVAVVGETEISVDELERRTAQEWAVVAVKHGRIGATLPSGPGFDRCVEEMKADPGDSEARPPDSLRQQCQGQYEEARDAAMASLLTDALNRALAEHLGVEPSEQEIQDALRSTKRELFVDDADYRAYLETSGMTDADFTARVSGDLRVAAIGSAFLHRHASPDPAAIRRYYRRHRGRFTSDAVTVVFSLKTPTRQGAEEALRDLEAGVPWRTVVAERGNGAGPVTTLSGGPRSDALARLAGSSDVGDLQGPIKLADGWLIFEVARKSGTQRQPLSKVRDAIAAQLASRSDAEEVTAAQSRLRQHWLARVRCRDDVAVAPCPNARP